MLNVTGWWGSLGTHFDSWVTSAWVAAVAGRLAWHTRLVQKGERRFISKELFFEIPIVFFTYLLGTGAVSYFGWHGQIAGAVVSVISYLGPGGLQVIAQRYAAMKLGKD